MTTKPELRLGGALAPGILAVGLFAVGALVVLNTPFPGPTGEGAVGFPDGLSITAEIGYALLDLTALQDGAVADTEPFLAAFLLVALALDAALDAALVLANREESGESTAALATTPADSGALADEGARPAAADGSGADDGPQSTESDAGGENA